VAEFRLSSLFFAPRPNFPRPFDCAVFRDQDAHPFPFSRAATPANSLTLHSCCATTKDVLFPAGTKYSPWPSSEADLDTSYPFFRCPYPCSSPYDRASSFSPLDHSTINLLLSSALKRFRSRRKGNDSLWSLRPHVLMIFFFFRFGTRSALIPLSYPPPSSVQGQLLPSLGRGMRELASAPPRQHFMRCVLFYKLHRASPLNFRFCSRKWNRRNPRSCSSLSPPLRLPPAVKLPAGASSDWFLMTFPPSHVAPGDEERREHSTVLRLY